MPKAKAPRTRTPGEITALSLQDVDAAHALDQLCFRPGVAFGRDVFEYCLQSPDCLSLGVKTAKGELLAFTILQARGQHTAQIVTIDVRPKQRRHGLADRLMAVAETILRNNHIRRVYLQVATDNGPGQSLYRKWGYEQKNLLLDYYGPGLDAVMMSKGLGSEKG